MGSPSHRISKPNRPRRCLLRPERSEAQKILFVQSDRWVQKRVLASDSLVCRVNLYGSRTLAPSQNPRLPPPIFPVDVLGAYLLLSSSAFHEQSAMRNSDWLILLHLCMLTSYFHPQPSMGWSLSLPCTGVKLLFAFASTTARSVSANNHSIAYCSRGWHSRTQSSTGLCHHWQSITAVNGE